ncbi:MAG: hypothetical protein U0599_13390 [Vicinamibacteria bacterium]
MLIANAVVWIFSGLEAHDAGPKACPLFYNDERDIRYIAGPLQFCARDRAAREGRTEEAPLSRSCWPCTRASVALRGRARWPVGGRPSRWITLRALRVLRWADAAWSALQAERAGHRPSGDNAAPRRTVGRGEETRVSEEDLKAEAEKPRLKEENERLKNRTARGISLKVSEKGALSVYGLGRFPVTLYKEQWEKLLGIADEIRAFLKENDAQLKERSPERKSSACTAGRRPGRPAWLGAPGATGRPRSRRGRRPRRRRASRGSPGEQLVEAAPQQSRRGPRQRQAEGDPGEHDPAPCAAAPRARIRPRVAPRATRTPISAVRCATV